MRFNLSDLRNNKLLLPTIFAVSLIALIISIYLNITLNNVITFGQINELIANEPLNNNTHIGAIANDADPDKVTIFGTVSSFNGSQLILDVNDNSVTFPIGNSSNIYVLKVGDSIDSTTPVSLESVGVGKVVGVTIDRSKPDRIIYIQIPYLVPD